MVPVLFLGLVILLTVAAFVFNVILRQRRRSQLHKLAVELRMAYSPYDRFGLADRVADRFPIPGAASLKIMDLLYSSRAGEYRYLFSAEYTVGVIRSKRRMLRAATFCEPKGKADHSGWTPIVLAPDDLPLIEQYRHLAAQGVQEPQMHTDAQI